MKVYEVSGCKGYTYNMDMYLGKGSKCTTATMTEETTSIENVGHKLFMENFFSLDNYLLTNTINSCDIAGLNQKEMPIDFGKKLQMKQGDKD
jgi:hypothetical protein